MDYRAVFASALGIVSPWEVVEIRFSREQHQLDIWVDFPRGSTFACPACGRPGAKVYDTDQKTWRHLNFFQYRTYLHARVPRVECPGGCPVRQVQVPWARPRSEFTLYFEGLIMVLARDMPVKAIAELVGEHDTRLWRILDHYVNEARAKQDYSQVRRVGVDETAAKRGHNYISLFVDLDVPQLLFATPGKESDTVAAFSEDLQAHGGRPEDN